MKFIDVLRVQCVMSISVDSTTPNPTPRFRHYALAVWHTPGITRRVGFVSTYISLAPAPDVTFALLCRRPDVGTNTPTAGKQSEQDRSRCGGVHHGQTV